MAKRGTKKKGRKERKGKKRKKRKVRRKKGRGGKGVEKELWKEKVTGPEHPKTLQ